jgi:hypothetical protein
VSALSEELNSYVSAIEAAESSTFGISAKFHGEASTREEFGWIMSNGDIYSIATLPYAPLSTSVVTEVSRTVTISRWVEVTS